jgi:hypothetical protein
MSRAQEERPSGLQQGAESAQSAAGGTTGATGTTTTSAYARGTGAAPGYPPESAPMAGYQETTGDSMLGGTFLIIAGLLTFFAGLAGVVKTHYYHAVTGYAYAWNVHSWGWAMLILGVVLFAVGACALLGMAWARPVGVGLAVLGIIGSFMFLVYTPVWGIIMLAVSALAIWGLLRPDSA